MKKPATVVAVILLVAGATVAYAGEGGTATASMNVSVTVVESSGIQLDRSLVSAMNGQQLKAITDESAEGARIRIPSKPHSQLSVRVAGERRLSDGNGRSIGFDPQIRVTRNVSENQELNVGDAQTITYTENDNGGYRPVAVLQLFGELDAGDHKEGMFTTEYTITAEHF